MATAEQYIKTAARHIGVSGTDNIFNTWYYGYHVYDPDTYPWCAAFQSYVAVKQLGMKIHASASAAGVANQGTRVDDSKVKPGDWVVFNWNPNNHNTDWCDHIGLVEWFDHDTQYFGTIEGNCDDQVMRVTRYNDGPYFTAFFRPPYDGKDTSKKVKTAEPRYMVQIKDGSSKRWLPEMEGKKDLGGSSDTFAGEGEKHILALAVKGVGKYRVKTMRDGWLEYVTGYSASDPENGYAGWRDSAITAVHIPNTAYKVQVRHEGVKGFRGSVQGKAAGDGKTPIVAIRIMKA